MVRAHWSEELTRAWGIVAAETNRRDEVRAPEEANARPSAEPTQASTRPSAPENARKLVHARIAERTAAPDAAQQKLARPEEAHALLRRQDDSAASVATVVSVPQAAGSPGLQMAREASMLDGRSALRAGDIRVFIHHVANHEGSAALAQRLTDHLRHQGFTVADVRPVDFSIDTPSVRYFFERDRVASERLVEELRRFSDGGTAVAPDHASDFTHFLPKPRPGNVEVWVPASSG